MSAVIPLTTGREADGARDLGTAREVLADLRTLGVPGSLTPLALINRLKVFGLRAADLTASGPLYRLAEARRIYQTNKASIDSNPGASATSLKPPGPRQSVGRHEERPMTTVLPQAIEAGDPPTNPRLLREWAADRGLVTAPMAVEKLGIEVANPSQWISHLVTHRGLKPKLTAGSTRLFDLDEVKATLAESGATGNGTTASVAVPAPVIDPGPATELVAEPESHVEVATPPPLPDPHVDDDPVKDPPPPEPEEDDAGDIQDLAAPAGPPSPPAPEPDLQRKWMLVGDAEAWVDRAIEVAGMLMDSPTFRGLEPDKRLDIIREAAE